MPMPEVHKRVFKSKMHTYAKHRFLNPWAKDVSFIPLGTFDMMKRRGDAVKVECYDLYALASSDGEWVDFGARYSDNGPDYISGSAYRIDGEWRLYVSGETAIAAARYFANHCERGVK